MPSPGLDTIKEIGKLPLINTYADPELKYSNQGGDDKQATSNTFGQFRQRLMRPVDIFPVKFQVETGTLEKALLETELSCSELPVVVDFVKGIVEYNLKLAGIKLCNKPVSGLRIWTNNETNSTDGFQNAYKQNKIVETFNNVIDAASKANEFTRSIGAISDPTQPTPMQPLAAALLDSRHLSLPKIWENTTYEPQLDITTKLISPYGNEKSFIRNIAKPLLYLLALTAPSTYDGVTFGQPANMYIRAYGITFMPLAYADSVRIVRGGTEGRVNWNKQPLELSVSMSFKPAMPGFAAFLPPNQFNFDTGLGSTINNLLGGALDMAAACAGFSCNDPIATMDDIKNNDTNVDLAKIFAGAGTLKIPGVTSLGNIIQSLRPTPADIRTTPPSLLNYYEGGNPITYPQSADLPPAPTQTAMQSMLFQLERLGVTELAQLEDVLNTNSTFSTTNFNVASTV